MAGVRLHKKFRTTILAPSAQAVPNLLARDFTADAPDTKYVGNITHLPAGDARFLYL